MNKQLVGAAALGILALLPSMASADGYYDRPPNGPGDVLATVITMPFVAAGVALNTAAALATAPFTGRFEGPLGPAFNPPVGPAPRPAYYAPPPVTYAPAPRPSYYAPPPAVTYAPAPAAYYAQPAPVVYYAPRVAYRPYYAPAPVYYAAPRY
jgi:hypothetical protein